MKKQNLVVWTCMLAFLVITGCSSDKPAAQQQASSNPGPATSSAAVTPPKAEAEVKPPAGTPSGAGSTGSAAASSTPEVPKVPATPTPEPAKPAAPTVDAKPAPAAAQEQPKAAAPAPAPAPVETSKPAAETKAPVVTATAAKAETLFKDNCMACHGDQLQGGMGPNISAIGSKRSKDELIAKINGGGKVMPAFKDMIKTDEVEALASWLASKK